MAFDRGSGRIRNAARRGNAGQDQSGRGWMYRFAGNDGLIISAAGTAGAIFGDEGIESGRAAPAGVTRRSSVTMLELAIASVMEDKQDYDDDGDRHPKQPQQDSTAHGSAP